ncbi:hypothetical protein JFU08_02425 [Bacillus sp. TH23]|nr:hypothetical protein [Bacillus sp. TH23]
MGKTSKYVTAAALCSTIVMGGLQASAVSYAATNPTTVTTQSDAKLLNDFRKELKNRLIIEKKILQSHIKQKIEMLEILWTNCMASLIKL